jgi:hypothetical protein
MNKGRDYRNLFTGETLSTLDQEAKPVLALGAVFAHCPVALLEAVL